MARIGICEVLYLEKIIPYLPLEQIFWHIIVIILKPAKVDDLTYREHGQDFNEAEREVLQCVSTQSHNKLDVINSNKHSLIYKHK